MAAQRIDLTALNGNIIGVNPVTRADVRAPTVNFVASGSVGILGGSDSGALGNQFATTTPGFVQQFPLPPAPPPPPTPDSALLEPLIVRIPVDSFPWAASPFCCLSPWATPLEPPRACGE
ncbi:hypothetical protein IV102_36335 [bacterium]|nr:hypothetical protein [bacterium]